MTDILSCYSRNGLQNTDEVITYGVRIIEVRIIEVRIIEDVLYGHHSCKMYHRERLIQFGFQFWVLAGDDGCPFHVEPYQGKSEVRDGPPFGTKVVHQLVEYLDQPEQHYLYFDNLFCSLPLLEDLRKRKIKATGQ